MRFDIAVERVLKGDTALKVVSVVHAWRRRGIVLSENHDATIVNRVHGLWFLRKAGLQQWDSLPVDGPDGIMSSLYFAAAQSVPLTYQATSTTDVSDAVAVELAAGIQLAQGDPETFVGATTSMNSSTITNLLSMFLSSPVLKFQIAGISGLLQRGGSEILAQLSRLWPIIEKDSSRSRVLASLRDSFRDQRADSVTQLTLLAASPSVELRSSAINALAAIHTKEAMPFLAGLLNSSSPDEQMKGVFGLSAFANGCPMQTPENVASMEYLQFSKVAPMRTKETVNAFAFRRGPTEQEAKLVSFWSNWWSVNQGILQ